MFSPRLSSSGERICYLKFEEIVIPGPIVQGFPTRYTTRVVRGDAYANEMEMLRACPKQLCFL